MTDDDLEQMRTQANRLSFNVSEDVLRTALETATQLADKGGDLTDGDAITSMGRQSTDEYNALLDTYGEPRVRTSTGRLSGLTVAVKDNIAVRGLELTCGSTQLSTVPTCDATVVTRLLDAGAAIVGKANQDALAFGPTGEFSDHGPVWNPCYADRVPGGSSSGSGVAVAAGLVDAALGTDTGGSIRIPAACCGVVGVKPTHGLVPRDGFIDFAPSLDTIGPLAQDVPIAAAVLEATVGYDEADPSSRHRGMDHAVDLDGTTDFVVGLPTPFFDRSHAVVAEAVREAVDGVECLTTEEIDLSPAPVEQAYFLIAATEFVWFLDQTGSIRGQGTGYSETLRSAIEELTQANLGEHVAARILPAAFLDAKTAGQAYATARRQSIAFKRRLSTVFDSVDVLVTPTIRILPPKRGTVQSAADMLAMTGNTSPFNLGETPAVSVPVDTHETLPISAQVITPRFTDQRALRIARALERATV